MPKRSSKNTPKNEDPNKRALRVVREATEEEGPAVELAKGKAKKNPAAVSLGRLGGKKGGKARAAKLTPEQRAEIARTAALARWYKSDD